MAEGILRFRAEEAGIRLFVDSAGTGGWHAGEAPDERAERTARKRGVDISRQKARQIREEDFAKFDLILCADAEVYRNVKALAGSKHQSKVDLIMNLSEPGRNRAVPDPYYGGLDGFEQVFDMLDTACQSLIGQLRNS